METIKYIETEPSNLEPSNRRLHIHVGSRRYVSPEEIQHLESDLNYTLITLIDGKKILSSTTLKKIESRLVSFKNFVRVNKSAIVNLDLIKSHVENGFMLPDKRILTFSRRQGRSWKERELS
jgi:DNA-binding LytR/AlgR family response regulator